MSNPTDTVKPRPEEMFRSLGVRTYEEAYAKGMSLSSYLEEEYPQEEYKDGLDAFSRLLKIANIKVRSNHRAGYYADPVEAFDKSDQARALWPEWVHRQWRRSSSGYEDSGVSQRGSGIRGINNIYTSVDQALNTWGHPYVDDPLPRFRVVLPPIPLEEIVALTTPIDSDAYRAFYLTDDASQNRRVRVQEGGEIPRAKLTGTQHVVTMYKFGRGLEMSYEQIRRQRLDWMAFQIGRMAVQSEADKVAAAIDVLLNGDGNANVAATNYNLTSLDSAASAGTLTLKGYMAYKLKFKNPYMLTTALVQESVALQMFLLNTGTANIPLVYIQGGEGLGSFSHINPGLSDNVRLGWTSDAPSLKILGFDARFALQQLVEVGSNISEIAQYIERQTKLLTITEVQGFMVLDPLATITLNVNA